MTGQGDSTSQGEKVEKMTWTLRFKAKRGTRGGNSIREVNSEKSQGEMNRV